jgi:hypothetical protein
MTSGLPGSASGGARGAAPSSSIDRAAASGYNRLVTFLTGVLDWVGYALVALLVALLPQALKREGRLAAYASPVAHVVSGTGESLLSAALFWSGLIDYVAGFGRTAGWTYLTHQRALTTGDFLGVGALGYLSYLVRPQALLLLYCFVEGMVRALEVVFAERLAGLGPIWLVWQGWRTVRRRSHAARLALLLGPPRPDEVVLPTQSRFRMLEIYSVEAKPWRDEQVVALGESFYRLTGRRLVPRGTHHAYRYLLHELEEREVIRGAIQRYDPPPPPPRPTPRDTDTTQ